MEKTNNNVERIKVGDLVRLKDDVGVDVSVGLVIGERDDCIDFKDMLGELRSGIVGDDPRFIEEIPDFLLYKPVYLVLWQGENIAPTDKPVWMFRTEIELVEKK
tara:strand:- start:93 stop:404 length:312 start_codon:yes stop_codon:yes gene_type:complete